MDSSNHRSKTWPAGTSGSRRLPTFRLNAATSLLAAKSPAKELKISRLAKNPSPATDEEVRAAAIQFVPKISGSTRPSQANEAAFDRAVGEVTRVSRELIDSLVTSAPPKNREAEAAKRRARAAQGFGITHGKA